MILIEDDILDLIAGGTPTITIIGTRDDGGNYDPGWGGGGGGGGGYGGGGGSPAPADPPPPPCVHSSAPPVGGGPANVDLNALRDLTASLGRQIMTMNQNIEHGVLIMADASGNLRAGAISAGDEDTSTAGADLRAGEKIVAWLHSHPESTVDQRYPSTSRAGDDGDTVAAARMLGMSATDQNMLMNILDIASGDVYEYKAKGPVNATPPLGKNITDDTNGCTR